MDWVQKISVQLSPDWQLYRACIRCLHVLSSRDEITDIILKSDSVDCITAFLSKNTTAVDAIASSCIFFASLGYSSIPEKEKLFTKQLFELVSTQMKKMEHARVFAFGCSFFSSMSIHDMGVRLVSYIPLQLLYQCSIKSNLVGASLSLYFLFWWLRALYQHMLS